jgi:hypothetical protein
VRAGLGLPLHKEGGETVLRASHFAALFSALFDDGPSWFLGTVWDEDQRGKIEKFHVKQDLKFQMVLMGGKE